MPYITNEVRDKFDREIEKLATHLVDTIKKKPGIGKYVFFCFLTVLFKELDDRIVLYEEAMRYRHFNHLHGAFDCAGKELWRRWGDHKNIRPKFLNWKNTQRMTERAVNDADIRVMCMLVLDIVTRYETNMDQCVGEVNYTISEVANMLANTGRASHQDLVNMVFCAANYIYFTRTGPYEDAAIKKNGDTAGFQLFVEAHTPTAN